MPYYRQRRRTRGYRPRARFSRSYARPVRRRSRTQSRRVNRTTYRRQRVVRGRTQFSRRSVRRRRTRTARPRTIRIVVQTVQASPTSLGVKGNQPTRAVF